MIKRFLVVVAHLLSYAQAISHKGKGARDLYILNPHNPYKCSDANLKLADYRKEDFMNDEKYKAYRMNTD